MKKKFILPFILLGLLFSPAGGFAANEPTICEEEEECSFNRGKVVNQETYEFQKAQKRAQYKNWGLAFGSTVIGIVTLVLVSKNHHN